MLGVEFERITYRQYLLALKAYRVKRSHEFENTRAIIWTYSMINRGKNDPYLTMHEFWPLETDGITTEDPKDFETRAKEHLRKVREAYKGKNPNIKNV